MVIGDLVSLQWSGGVIRSRKEERGEGEEEACEKGVRRKRGVRL